VCRRRIDLKRRIPLGLWSCKCRLKTDSMVVRKSCSNPGYSWEGGMPLAVESTYYVYHDESGEDN
jgi:hypothetical protein